MKKRISLFVTTVLAVLMVPAATLAISGFTDVTGVITYQGVHVGQGVVVTVECNGNVLTDNTDASGTYFVQFPKQQCLKPDLITVTADSNNHEGKATGKATEETTKLNVALINVSIVPEFGLIGLAGATLIGGAAFMIVRRRQLGDHQA
jgi:hypothetical protein